MSLSRFPGHLLSAYEMGAILAALYFMLIFFVPESPRWLVGRGQDEQARAVLARIHGPGEVDAAWLAIRESSAGTPDRLAGLANGKMRRVLGMALGIAFLPQIAAGVFYFFPPLLTQAGFTHGAALDVLPMAALASVGVSLAAVLLMDRLGRKPWLIAGASAMAVSLLTCGWAFHSADYQLTARSYGLLAENKVPPDFLAELKISEGQVFPTDAELVAELDRRLGADRVAVYREALTRAARRVPQTTLLLGMIGLAASLSISFGSVTLLLLAELFGNRFRAVATSLTVFSSCAVGMGLICLFPWERSHLGVDGTCLGCALLVIVALAFIAAPLPETKGQTLEELESALARAPTTVDKSPSYALK
jgi:MFS family permease